MRPRTQTLLVVAALLGARAPAARGQNAPVDPRWLAYLGCWESIDAAQSDVCVVPAAGSSSVDLVTIVNGRVTARERIAASGERLETTHGDCPGWHSATWSAHGQRLYLRSEDACSGGNARAGTGLIAMSGNGQWLYIEGMTLGGQTGVRVQRYREAMSDMPLPSEVTDALQPGVSATIQARAAAGTRLSIDDVVEASQNMDAGVLEAWLVERAEPFTLDAKRLIALADAGVPPPVIDLMVALSYPKVFTINAASRQGERRVAPPDSSRGGTGLVSAFAPIDQLCLSSYLLDAYTPYACVGLGSGYGYGYGYGWYQGAYPVTIVYTGSGSSRPHGRVVNGQGYTQAGSTGTAAALPPPSGALSGSASSPSLGSTSSSGEQRTAKPRPPQ